MTLTDFKDKLSFYVPPSELATITHVVVSGKGSFYQDADGKNFLDFSSGIFSNNFGHGDKEITEILAKVFGSIGNIHGRQWIGAPDFYRRLFCFLPSKDYHVVAYGDGGGYTVDRCLTELFYHFGKRPFNLLTLAGGFHGKTIGNKLAVNPKESCSFFHTHTFPPPYCYRCPFGKERTTCRLECATKLEEQLLQTQAQVFMFEPVLGGAVIVPPTEYWQRIAKFCRAHSVILVADEVLVGGGRVGTFLASTHYGITPDAIFLTKGLADGLPLSVMLLKKELTDNPYSRRELNYSSTFVNVPALMAVASKVMEKLERDNIFANVRARSEQLLHGLKNLQKKFPIIGDVRGIGLIVGVEFIHSDKSPDAEVCRKVFKSAENNGLELILPTSNVLRFAPPLNITDEEIYLCLKLFERSLHDVR